MGLCFDMEGDDHRAKQVRGEERLPAGATGLMGDVGQRARLLSLKAGIFKGPQQELTDLQGR